MDDGETTEAEVQGEDAAPEKPPAYHTLDAVDAALAPAFKNASNLGTVSYSELKHALTCVRQAISHVLFPPELPSGEPVEYVDAPGDQIKAQLSAAASKPAEDAGIDLDPEADPLE